MSGLEIVEDGLERASNSIGDVAATMAGVDLPTAMTHVPAAIPGATSASLASSATTALDTRRDSLQERYQDFSADVMTAANAYLADDAEAEEAMNSAGELLPTTPPTDRPSTGWRGRMYARME